MSKFNLKNEPVVITKDTMNRLIKDLKEIIQHPLSDNGIFYSHDEENMLKGYAMIIGPTETPYFGGYYFFELNYPSDYPHSPPKVKYWTNANNIRFNPNLYVCGKVCVSLLNTWRGEQWTSCQTISTVLLTLCTLLCNDPLLNEPGVEKSHFDMNSYNEIINYANIDIAVCDIIEKKNGVFMPFFENFYPFIKENFIKNYDNLIEFSNKKNEEFKNGAVYFKTGYYSMNVNVDYNKLINKLNQCKELINS